MNQQQKYKIAAEAVKNGIGPEQLKAMLTFLGNVTDVLREAFDANMEVLNELYPDEETESEG